MAITIPPFNISGQMAVIERYTDLANPGWIYPVQALYGGMANIAWILVALFTIGIVFIRTNSPTALAFVTLLFAALFVAFVPGMGLKIMYLVVVLTVAAAFYLVFGRD